MKATAGRRTAAKLARNLILPEFGQHTGLEQSLSKAA
jgi:hypothetical protein